VGRASALLTYIKEYTMSEIKLTKDGGVKVLSKESGLIAKLLEEGWEEVKAPKKKKKEITED
jgi:hypothetical protein